MSVEYHPWQKIPTMLKFPVWNLPPSFLARLEKSMAARKRQAAAEAAEHRRQCEKLKVGCLPTSDSPNCAAYRVQCGE
jgi:hypothetical protein